jgi:MFS family permease
VGGAAWLSAELASRYGYAWYPFVPGLLFAGAGLLITLFFIKDTRAFVQTEMAQSRLAPLRNVWLDTSWRHKNIGTVTLNGLVNNMNDAMVWGLLPLLMTQRNFSGAEIGLVAGIYPAVWGLLQLFTGALGDSYCKKQIISIGMWVQAGGILLLALGHGIGWLIAGAAILGIGTALVYPNFLTVVAESTHPAQRAESLSIFRFWRDSGYVFGALLTGLLADWLGINATLLTVAALTAGAGVVAHLRMCCTLKKLFPAEECARPATF